MTLKRTASFAFIMMLSSTALQSCAPTNDLTAKACTQSDITPVCITENAAQVLAQIDNPFNWATSAAELAIAQDNWSQSETALGLVHDAVIRAEDIQDAKRRATAYGDIALSLSKIKVNPRAVELIDELTARAETIESADKKWDVLGKLITARAVHDYHAIARDMALVMADKSASQDAFRGRTQREIAGVFAKMGDFETAVAIINEIDADFTYYSAVARTDVAAIAIKAGRTELAQPLLDEAKTIADMQDNGYFSGAILRDIGYNLIIMNEPERATEMIDQALEAARNAKSKQEAARALSRIATRLSDAGETNRAKGILTEALSIARGIDSPVFTHFALYEIAGSAAFSSQFDLAREIITDIPETPFSSAVSLKAASQRDLAWGLARHGQIEEAAAVANAITSPREKVHALSRLARLIKDPNARAHARYL